MLKLQHEGRYNTLTSTEMLVTAGDQSLILEIYSGLEVYLCLKVYRPEPLAVSSFHSEK